MGEKRKRGRPRVPDDQRTVSVSTWLQPSLCDRLIRRAQHEQKSVSQIVRDDLTLLETMRQRKREGRDA